MAKNNMRLKYKPQKREKNKKNTETINENSVKSFIFTVVGVLAFIGLIYLGILGLEKLGLFEAGYQAPAKAETTIDYEKINIGTVFNRNEKSYYVLFDNYDSIYKSNSYINTLLSSQETYRVYKVDMSRAENAKYSSEEPNPDAKNASELKINGLTLIKITNGEISEYIVGSEKIEKYLTK